MEKTSKMEPAVWYTDVSEFTKLRTLVSSIVFIICFLIKQYNQFRKKQNVSNQSTQTPNPQRQSKQTQTPDGKSKVSNTATQTFDEDFWMSSSAEDNDKNYCDICDVTREAGTYCSQCKQFFCRQCSSAKISLTKNHVSDAENVTEKMLKNRHLALWSTYRFSEESANKLIGFSYAGKQSDFRFVAQRISSNYLDIGSPVRLGFVDAKDDRIVSINDFTIKNLTVLYDRRLARKLFYFVTGNELTYFTFRHYKSICKMEKDTKTATVVFTTPGHCYGITKFDKGLALVHEQYGSFATPKWQIHVYTFEGVLKQQILYDKDKKALFEQPEYLSANTEENILYATDTKKNVLYALDTKGTILFIFQSKDMVAPRGISTDPEGNIYIACNGRVLQLLNNGVQHRTLLHMGERKVYSCVEDVYFDRENTQLAVIEDFKHGNVFKFLRD